MLRKSNGIYKRGQVTIFIILALIIVVSIILLFLLIRKPQLQIEDIENPQVYIDSCVSEFTEEAINVLSEQGGDIAPEGSTMFRGKNITYLCYNANFYEPCIMQRPDLITHIEDEITYDIEPKIDNCFNALKEKLESKNYNIEMGNMQLQTELQSGKVVINIDRDFKMTKREETRSFDNFKSIIANPIKDLAEVAMEIANQEAKYCNFDILGYMIFYPEYNLDKFRPGDGDVIYYLRHIQTNKRFVLAIRSCALPPGF
jgi:hypothetical protein